MNVIDLAVKSVLISLIGFCLFVMVRRSTASVRHFALALTLFSLCALPILIPFMPSWHVPFLKVEGAKFEPVATKAFPDGMVVVEQPEAPSSSLSQLISHVNPEIALLSLWAIGAGLFGLRVAVRLGRLRILERQLPMCALPELQAVVAEHCRQHKRHFLLLESEANEPPMTWGQTRPVLLLPSVAREWSDERLKSVLLHELAHVERGDWIVSLAAEVVSALFWFNPLVWVMRKRLEIESELAADDWVLSRGVPQTQYAQHLVDLIRDLKGYPRSADAALAMARPGRLDSRVQAILEDRGQRRNVSGSVTFGLVGLLASMVIVIAAATPTVIRDFSTEPMSVEAVGTDTVPDTSDLAAGQPVVPDVPAPPAVSPSDSDAMVIKPLPNEVHSTPVLHVTPIRTIRAELSSGHAPKEPAHADSSERHARSETTTTPDRDDLSKSLDREMRSTDSEIKSAQAEVRTALQEANLEMSKHHLPIDVSSLITGAMESANHELKAAKLSKAASQAIAEKALAEVSKALKSIPKSKDDSGD